MPTTHRPSAAAIGKIWDRLSGGDYAALDERMLTEAESKAIAERIEETSSFGDVFHLIEAIPFRGQAYDWNVGGLVRHLEIDLVVSSMQHAENLDALYDSVGLAWAFGQYRNRNPYVTDYLYAVVRQAKNADAWWQAAFSLENLGVDNAVYLLKHSLQAEKLGTVEQQLKKLDDKRSLITLLLLCDEASMAPIHAKIRQVLVKGGDDRLVAHACWLAGRLRIFDDAIVERVAKLLGSADYDVKHYAFFALQNLPTDKARLLLERELGRGDTLSRKFAARGLRVIGNPRSLDALEAALHAETDPVVTFEISKSVYRLKNSGNAELLRIRHASYRNENGAVASANPDPAMYDLYAEAQDPEGLAFSLIRRKIGGRTVNNPIDARMRTGRLTRQMFEGVDYRGTLYGVEASQELRAYADRQLRRERNFGKEAKTFRGTLAQFAKRGGVKSGLIVSAFGYEAIEPKAYLQELKAAYALLAEDGEYWTVGWDELYNDAVGSMWFKYAADGKGARNFEEWRTRRAASGGRASSGLTWYKRGLHAPLQFATMEESAAVMGYLFGRDAAQYAIRNRRTEWGMSLGITRDTKQSLKKAIDALEAGE